ncbi:MAG: SBBP repeat-containing protein, partial [candidate division WOR-3 bacterium]|nr:SBBP repeat-containing protein [candidate division WOR-3 bacterium]
MKINKYLFILIFLIIGSSYARVDTSWVKRYNAYNDTDYARAIVVDTAGNVYVTGSSKGSAGKYDVVTIKYNTNGTPQWLRRFVNPDNENSYANSITTDNAGNVYVVGCIYSPSTLYNYLIVKYNNNGTYQWHKTYDGPGHGIDEAFAIAVDSVKNVYVTGKSQQGSAIGANFDIVTIKYDSSGNQK